MIVGPRVRLLALSLATMSLTVTGCTRGKKRSGEEKTRAEAAIVDLAAETDPWLAGVLPPEMYEGTPQPGGSLVVRVQSEPPSLDPLVDSDLMSTWMLDRKVYQGLAQLDATQHPDYPLKPMLATGWEVSDDGLTFTFHIRRGVKFHDGAPMSGQDVVATVRKILDPNVRSMHLRNYLEDLVSIDTLPGDDFTVVAKYKKPYFMAFRFLATLPVFPKHILDATPDVSSHPIHRAPVGTGPFKFVEWRTADRIVFARNENYWGRKAYVDRVVFRLVEDASVAFQLLQQGEFDLYTVLLPQHWAKDMPGLPSLRRDYHRVKFFQPAYSWIGWNNSRPFFADARVRLALTHLLDREGVRKHFLLGVDRPTTCHFYQDSAACDQSLLPREYDPKEAVRLLEEAGWGTLGKDGIRVKDGVPFKFTFLITSSSTFGAKLAAYMQGQFRKYGIAVDIKKVEWALYTQMLREKNFDACSLAWGNTDVVSDPYQVWHSSQATEGSNYISFRNAEADRLIEQARGTLDDEARNALYRRFGRILYDENPYTFLYGRPSLDAVKKRVRGLRPSVAWYDLEDVWLDQGGAAAATAPGAN